eukprot:8736502-Pyramimonas_sp.AAC.1
MLAAYEKLRSAAKDASSPPVLEAPALPKPQTSASGSACVTSPPAAAPGKVDAALGSNSVPANVMSNADCESSVFGLVEKTKSKRVELRGKKIPIHVPEDWRRQLPN